MGDSTLLSVKLADITCRCRGEALRLASASFRSVSVVSAVVRRPTPLGLKDALADVAVDRGVRRLLMLGRDVPQKRVLRRERVAALVAVRRRVDVPDVHHRHLRRLYKCIPQVYPGSLASTAPRLPPAPGATVKHIVTNDRLRTSHPP